MLVFTLWAAKYGAQSACDKGFGTMLAEPNQVFAVRQHKAEHHLNPQHTDNAESSIPINNNASERAIRGFCVGKKNWQMIDTINGAKTSAIIYSIVETAKANNLKPFNYVQYLLEEIPKHMDETDYSFLKDLLPWSENLPEEIRKS